MNHDKLTLFPWAWRQVGLFTDLLARKGLSIFQLYQLYSHPAKWLGDGVLSDRQQHHKTAPTHGHVFEQPHLALLLLALVFLACCA